MPLFPVFTRSGEVTLSLDIVTHEARFSEAQFDQMLQFHHFLFGQVLRLDKDPMRFDPRNAACGYIIVPLNGGKLGSGSGIYSLCNTVAVIIIYFFYYSARSQFQIVRGTLHTLKP